MKNIEVLRRLNVVTKKIEVGDRLRIYLTGFGDFTATAHKITDRGILFVFDDCVAMRPMNEKLTNEGGYEKSDLKRWMDAVLLAAFPDILRNRIEGLTIPTVGELFYDPDNHSINDMLDHYEADSDERLPLMKELANRFAFFKGETYSGWLRNAMNISEKLFAAVSDYGYLSLSDATCSLGIRPEFWLVR